MYTIPQLEITCQRCKGAGGETERGKWYNCHNCNGAGKVPTKAGKRILALMRHNFRLMLQDAQS